MDINLAECYNIPLIPNYKGSGLIFFKISDNSKTADLEEHAYVAESSKKYNHNLRYDTNLEVEL